MGEVQSLEVRKVPLQIKESKTMSENKLIENAKKEREFLHDISTPIMIASGHVEYLVNEGFEKDPEKAKYRLEKAFSSLQKLTDKLQERRKVLKALSGDNQ